MPIRFAPIAISVVVLHCIGFSFQVSAMTVRSTPSCERTLENHLKTFRARIMPVGQTLPEEDRSLTHQTSDGRILDVVVRSNQLEVLDITGGQQTSVFSSNLTRALTVRPLWATIPGGESALIALSDGILRVDFPGSLRRASLEFSDLPHGANGVQGLRFGQDLILMVGSPQGENLVMRFRQNQMDKLFALNSSPGEATRIFLVSDEVLIASVNRARGTKRALMVRRLDRPSKSLFSFPLRRTQRVVELRVSQSAARDSGYLGVITPVGQELIQITPLSPLTPLTP